MSGLFIPKRILRKPNEANIGRFAFIEKQQRIADKRIHAAFSHGEPLTNMASNHEIYTGEGLKNTTHFLEDVGFPKPTIFVFGFDDKPIQLSPTLIQQAENDTITTPHNFIWGKIHDFDKLTCIVKVADCLSGIGLGKGANNDTYFFFFHAGWKLINTKMIAKGLQQMQQGGCDTSSMQVGIAPSISQENLVFQSKDAETLLDANVWKGFLKPGEDNLARLDLGGAAIQQMTDAGIDAANIEWYNPNANPLFDTYASALLPQPLLFSHRAEKKGQREGRNITAFSIQNID